MMRLILLAAIVLPTCLLGQSDKKVPSFGKVDKSELTLTSCEFDKNAEAMVLADVGEFYCDVRGMLYTELKCYVRIKILKDEGLDRANIKIHYMDFRNTEAINDLAANTYNLDASGNIVTTKLEKKLIYTSKINSRYSEQSFTMPDVKVGSVIEYKYTIRGSDLKDWYMQGSLPVKFSTYTINFPSFFEVHTRPMFSFPSDSKDNSTGLRTIKTYTMKDIPALPDEDFRTCDDDYLQKIESWIVAYTYGGRRYPVLKSWREIATSLIEDEDFGSQLKKEIPRTADLDAALKTTKDTLQKMIMIHDYVKKHMAWDGNDNIWALHGVKAAWKERKGTSGEINLILINLLRDAGILVNPLLVSTREHGMVSNLFPNIAQFNKVLALVNIAGKTYVLDGTDKYTSSLIIPEEVMYSSGFVIDSKTENFYWVDIWDPALMDKNTVLLQAKINEKGELVGHVTVNSRDYARAKRIPALNAGKEKFINRFYHAVHPTATIDSFQVENENVDSLPLIQNFDFTMPLTSSGDYSYFSPHMFTSINSNPFVADKRSSDIFFGTNQVHTMVVNITIPEGYTFEELPKNTRLTIEDKSLVVTRMTATAGNVLNARITVEYNRPFYSVDEYEVIREFYKKMYSLLEEQIVIKRKA